MAVLKVELEVPDGIVRFLKEVCQYSDAEVRTCLEEALQEAFGCHWGAFLTDPAVFMDLSKIIEKYDLRSTVTLKSYIEGITR